MRLLVCGLVVCMVLLFAPSVARADCNTATDCHYLAKGVYHEFVLSQFSPSCVDVTNNSGSEIMIPTLVQQEWTAFVNNPPPNVIVQPCTQNVALNWVIFCSAGKSQLCNAGSQSFDLTPYKPIKSITLVGGNYCTGGVQNYSYPFGTSGSPIPSCDAPGKNTVHVYGSMSYDGASTISASYSSWQSSYQYVGTAVYVNGVWITHH